MTHPPGEQPDAGGPSRALPWGADAPLEATVPADAPPVREFDPRYGGPGLRWRGDGSLPTPVTRRPAGRHPIDAPDLRPFEPTAEDTRPGIAGRAYASFGRRLGAWAIDFVIRVILLWIVLAITGIEPPDEPFVISGPLFGTMQSLNLMYGWIFTTQGWSPGQRILRMRVVRADGLTAPGPWWAIVRTLGAFLSELAFFIGYLWMLWNPHRQTWHDRMARTYVVMAREEDYDQRRGRR